MTINLNLTILSVNGVFTFFLGIFLLHKVMSGQLQKHIFYYAWSAGFILYGTQIIARVISLPFSIPAAIMILALNLFLVGTWSLTRRKIIVYIIISVALSLTILSTLFLVDALSFDIATIAGNFIFYLAIIFSIVDHRVVFGRKADKLILGWVLLLFTNTFLYFDEWISDSLGILSKAIILLGLMEYDFVILAKRVQRGFKFTRLPVGTGAKKEGELKLVIPSKNSITSWKHKAISWVLDQVNENADNEIDSYIFTFQDILPHADIRRIKWINPPKINVFLFSDSSKKDSKEFTIISTDLTKIGATLNELGRKYSNTSKGCKVFFTDISVLIHLFGEHQVYRLLLEKMGILREAGIELYGVFLPQTHDQSVVSLFESIADEIIRL